MSFPTVTLLSSPMQWEPVNTDGLWFKFYSASYSYPTFKYITNTYCSDLNGNTYSLGSNIVYHRISEGGGIFTPDKMLKTKTNNKFLSNIGLTGVSQTFGSMNQYWVDYGFQMSISQPYYDFGFTGPTFGIVFSSPPSDSFLVGDVIYVSKTNTKINPSYSGFQTVTEVVSPTFIATTAEYTGVDSPNGTDGGTITNISRITDTTYVNATQSGSKFCWNATRQYEQKNYDFGTYAFIGRTQSFLTYYENDTNLSRIPANMKPIRLDQYETVSFIADGSTQPINQLIYVGYDNNNILVQGGLLNLPTPITTKGKFDIGVGPLNIIGLFGNVFDDVVFYRVTLLYNFFGPNTRVAGMITRKIDNSCTSFEVVQLRFLNRLGGYECYNFIRNSKQTLTVEKEERGKELPWNYALGDRVMSVLKQDAEISWVVNTDWVSEYDYNFLQELVSSPEVYRVSGTNSYPVIITDISWVQKTYLQEQIFNLTVNFKEAYNIMTQDN